MQHGSRRKNWFNNHYPFGSIVESRSWKGDYRYGFQHWECDDDVKGAGNHLSFADYGYDPRLGRRWNVDPLALSIPFNSPFMFSGNNPILFVDGDGLDYGIEVDNKKKTITVKATIYTTNKDVKELQEGITHWTNQIEKYQVEVTNVEKRGFLGFGRVVTKELYDINFKFEIKSDNKTNNEAQIAWHKDETGFANTYLVTPHGEVLYNAKREEIRGEAKDNPSANRGTSMIKVGYGWGAWKTTAHELGHILGIRHWRKGLMEDGETRKLGEDEITKGNIREILSNVEGLTKKQKIGFGKNTDMPNEDGTGNAKATYIGPGRINGKAKVIEKKP